MESKNTSQVTLVQQADDLGLQPVQEQAKKKVSKHAEYLALFPNHGDEMRPPVFDSTHTLKLAPLFSGSILTSLEQPQIFGRQLFPQYGVLGMVTNDESQKSPEHAQDRLLFTNTEEPWSAFICGSQGSGKSHTLSCLLENNLLPDPTIGTLKTPLTGLVFHYDKFANFGNGQVCEAAYLCSALKGGIPVQVLVAPTSLKRMAEQYHNLPGLPEGCTGPSVLPLYFSQDQLSVDTMMILMAVNDTDVAAPLYISVIRQLLRDMVMDNQEMRGFDYKGFRQHLAHLNLTDGQSAPLNMRLELLQSFLLEADQTPTNQAAFRKTWTFNPGTLTIIDLSDQFVNESDACALFSICLKLFMADWQKNPRVIALDEAHKFLTESAEATKLTSDLISIIRQQRHMGARVIIATQEPTLSGTLLDLCNVSIIHRFNSPKWYQTLRHHLAGVCLDKEPEDSMFREIVRLSTGEALVFCPTAVLEMSEDVALPLRDGLVKILVRSRISADGGSSVQASSLYAPRRLRLLPALPQFQRFKGNAMPAPGSLAKKPHAKFTGDPTQVVTLSQTSSTSTMQQLSAPASLKRHKSSYDGTVSCEENSSETEAETSSDQDSDCNSDSCFPSTLVSSNTPVIRKEAEQNLKPHVIAIPRRAIPDTHKYGMTGISEQVLAETMRQVVQKAMNTEITIKNPSGYLNGWLKDVSRRLGLSPEYMSNRKLGAGCQDGTAIDLLKRVVKKHHEGRGVPIS